jgi:hypothetical protein
MQVIIDIILHEVEDDEEIDVLDEIFHEVIMMENVINQKKI